MKFRKVKFNLGEADGLRLDLTAEEAIQNAREEEENTRERNGLFHCWTPVITHNAATNENVPSIHALIEDCTSGDMYELPIRRFHFCGINEYEELP